VRLIIQPDDGVEPLVKAINKAKKKVEIVIFRFDQTKVEKALFDAVDRGVFVHALIAFTNKGGENHLRKLEMRFLEKGITVARTANDLVRYHGKMMLLDGKELYLLAFNFTHLDVEHSRSFGIVTRNAALVQEATRLFKSDTKRQKYSAGSGKFVVSPVNARKELLKFIKGAKKELLIYDVKVSDREVLRALAERAAAGVKVRVIGTVSGADLPVRKLARLRLHTRSIIRDRDHAFVGSQSLRALELDRRREIGVIFGDGAIVKMLLRTFESDWKSALKAKPAMSKGIPVKAAKKIAKVMRKKLPVEPVVEKIAREIKRKSNGKVDHEEIKQTLHKAVEDVVNTTVKKAAKHVLKRTVTELAVAHETGAN
jgi:phosphatidylserine/phosphatidylglycerophosphate/cardiolipin synthase-like enzyme